MTFPFPTFSPGLAIELTYIGELADNADGTCSGTLDVGATPGQVILAVRVVRSSGTQSVVTATINGATAMTLKHSTPSACVAAVMGKVTLDSGSIAMSARTNSSSNTITASVLINTNQTTLAPIDSAASGFTDNPTVNLDTFAKGSLACSGVSGGSGTAHTWTGATEDVETPMGSFGTGGAAHTSAIGATEANHAVSLSSGASNEAIAALSWNQVALGSRDLTFLANSLLLSCDGTDAATTLTDDSQYAHTPTFGGNAQIDTAQSVFGGASLLLDGTGDYVSFPNHPAWLFYDGDFDVQFRWRPAVNTTLQGLITLWNAGTNQRSWSLNYRGDLATDILQFAYSTAGTSGTVSTVDTGAFTPTVNTWYAIRVNRKAGTLRIWADGVMLKKATVTAAFFISTATLMIGGQDATSGTGNGHFDEIRIKKGYTDWDSDSNYTVETAVFSRS